MVKYMCTRKKNHWLGALVYQVGAKDPCLVFSDRVPVHLGDRICLCGNLSLGSSFTSRKYINITLDKSWLITPTFRRRIIYK